MPKPEVTDAMREAWMRAVDHAAAIRTLERTGGYDGEIRNQERKMEAALATVEHEIAKQVERRLEARMRRAEVPRPPYTG